MSKFARTVLPSVKLTLRETSMNFDSEIESYIDVSALDLQNGGILSSFFKDSLTLGEVDPQILQAIRYYCLSTYGLYNTDSEKYSKSYHSLKAYLATLKRYTEEDSSGI